MTNAKCLTLTYLTRASYASLNGSDKEADNISSIKKIKMNDGLEYPYKSSYEKYEKNKTYRFVYSLNRSKKNFYKALRSCLSLLVRIGNRNRIFYLLVSEFAKFYRNTTLRKSLLCSRYLIKSIRTLNNKNILILIILECIITSSR